MKTYRVAVYIDVEAESEGHAERKVAALISEIPNSYVGETIELDSALEQAAKIIGGWQENIMEPRQDPDTPKEKDVVQLLDEAGSPSTDVVLVERVVRPVTQTSVSGPTGIVPAEAKAWKIRDDSGNERLVVRNPDKDDGGVKGFIEMRMATRKIGGMDFNPKKTGIITSSSLLKESAFTDPFPGIDIKPMTPADTIRALRLDLTAEEDAIHLYTAHADAAINEEVKKVLRDIANEERVHVGELSALLQSLTGNEDQMIEKGKTEVSQPKKTEASLLKTSEDETTSWYPTVNEALNAARSQQIRYQEGGFPCDVVKLRYGWYRIEGTRVQPWNFRVEQPKNQEVVNVTRTRSSLLKKSGVMCPKCHKKCEYDDSRDAYVCNHCGWKGENGPIYPGAEMVNPEENDIEASLMKTEDSSTRADMEFKVVAKNNSNGYVIVNRDGEAYRVSVKSGADKWQLGSTIRIPIDAEGRLHWNFLGVESKTPLESPPAKALQDIWGGPELSSLIDDVKTKSHYDLNQTIAPTASLLKGEELSEELPGFDNGGEGTSADMIKPQPTQSDFNAPVVLAMVQEDGFLNDVYNEIVENGNANQDEVLRRVYQNYILEDYDLGQEYNRRLGVRASVKKTSVANEEVIRMFLLDTFPKEKRPNWGAANLKINKEDNGWSLMNYWTPILFRDIMGDVYFNTTKYSAFTSSIQNHIRNMANGFGFTLKEVDESGIKNAMKNNGSEEVTSTASILKSGELNPDEYDEKQELGRRYLEERGYLDDKNLTRFEVMDDGSIYLYYTGDEYPTVLQGRLDV